MSFQRRFSKILLSSLFIVLSIASLSFAAEEIAGIKPEMYGFTGRLVNSGSATFLKSEDYTDLKNFRHYEGGIGTRKGTAGWTTNAEPNRLGIQKIIPFFTDTEQHIIAASASSSGITYFKVEGGSFYAANAIYATSGSTETPVTFAKVRDTLVIGDAGGVTMYSGASVFPTALLIESNVSGSSPVFTDRYDWIYGNSTYSVPAGVTVHVGYSRPFDRFQANQNNSMYSIASGVTEYMKSGKMRFWASYLVGSGGSTFYLPKIESLARELGTSWDGRSWMYPVVAGVQLSGTSEFRDYSGGIRDESVDKPNPMDVSQIQSGGTIFLGFTWRPRQIQIFPHESYKNGTSAVMTMLHWNGSQYTSLPGASDGTSSGGITLKQMGVLDFDKVNDWTKRKVGSSPYDLYVIALTFNTTLSNYVKIYQIRAIPDYDSPSSVGKYKGVAAADDCLYLFNGRDKTKVLVSAPNQPDCFIGAYANDEFDKPLIIGRQENFTGVWKVGQRVIIGKESENFVQAGMSRATRVVDQLAGTAPVVAPESAVVIEYGGNVFLHYLGRDGFYALDGSGANPMTSSDIRNYWKPGDALELPTASMKAAKGWYDRVNEEYHCLVNSIEFVYSFSQKKWGTFDRGSAARISSGAYFMDPNKVQYHLLGGSGGTIFAAETGTSDYGRPIISDLTRPPIALGSRLGTKNDLRAMAIRYECPDGSPISGNSLYLTSSLGASVTTYGKTFDIADADWKFFDLQNVLAYLKGFTHKIRMQFRGRVNLDSQIIWSRDAPWDQFASQGTSGTFSEVFYGSSTATINQTVSVGGSFLDARSGDSIYVVVPYSMTMSGVSLIVPNASLAAGASIFYAPNAIPGITGSNLLADISNGGVSVTSKSGTTVVPAGSILNFVLKSVPTGASVWTVQLIGTKN